MSNGTYMPGARVQQRVRAGPGGETRNAAVLEATPYQLSRFLERNISLCSGTANIRGVRCAGAKVDEVRISGAGEIPKEISRLTELRGLWVISHRVTGTLPKQLADLTALESLVINGPSVRTQNPRLNQINSRLGISGTIPSNLGRGGPCVRQRAQPRALQRGDLLPRMGPPNCHFSTALVLRSTRISGTLPAHLPSIAVGQLDVRESHRLSGTLPSWLALTHGARLTGTSISGTLPASVAKSAGLWQLELPASVTNAASFPWLLANTSSAHRPPRPSTHVTQLVAEAAPSPPQCCIHGCSAMGSCRGGVCHCTGVDSPDCAAHPPSTCSARRGVFVSRDGEAVSASAPTVAHRSGGTPLERGCGGLPLSTMHNSYRPILYEALDAFLLQLLGSDLRAGSVECAELEWAPVYGFRLHQNLAVEYLRRLTVQVEAGRQADPSAGRRPRLHAVQLDRGVCDLPPSLYQPGDVARLPRCANLFPHALPRRRAPRHRCCCTMATPTASPPACGTLSRHRACGESCRSTVAPALPHPGSAPPRAGA